MLALERDNCIAAKAAGRTSNSNYCFPPRHFRKNSLQATLTPTGAIPAGRDTVLATNQRLAVTDVDLPEALEQFKPPPA